MADKKTTDKELSPENRGTDLEKQTEVGKVSTIKPTEGKTAKEEPAKQGNVEEETRQEKQKENAKPAKQEKTKVNKDIPSFLESYLKAYPKEKAFHVTSDNQVFLEKDLSLARLHQKGMKNGGELQTIKVK